MYNSVKDFKIETVEIAGLVSALQALRLPYGNSCRSNVYSDVYITPCVVEHLDSSAGYDFWFKAEGCADEKDIHLISTLIKRGDEHAKVLRGIIVWCKINAPRYWWQECDRYSVGACCLGSNSTMHQQGRGLSEDELVKMKEELPEGTMQERVWMFSYQTLRRIYFQRRNHRLPQWRMFCEWIEALPLSKELITVDGRNNKDK